MVSGQTNGQFTFINRLTIRQISGEQSHRVHEVSHCGIEIPAKHPLDPGGAREIRSNILILK